MPILLPTLLNFQGSSHLFGVGSFSQLDMFLAMLNYDGITIVDTSERIKAYNLFYDSKDDNKENINGGARHRAYEHLKNLEPQNRKGYVALYFQSQEGEIEFYKYNNDKSQSQMGIMSNDGVELSCTKLNPIHYFDASIMNTKSALQKSKYEEIKKKYNEIQQSCVNEFTKVEKKDLSIYFDLYILVDELVEAHNGINNFYTEPSNANNLKEYIEKKTKDVNNVLKQYTKMRIDLLSIVFRCFVGHASGYSWYAQDYLKKIIYSINEDIYKIYFENEEYLDIQLLWPIAWSSTNERWKEILNIIKSKYSNIVQLIQDRTYSSEEYYDMYSALTDDE